MFMIELRTRRSSCALLLASVAAFVGACSGDDSATTQAQAAAASSTGDPTGSTSSAGGTGSSTSSSAGGMGSSTSGAGGTGSGTGGTGGTGTGGSGLCPLGSTWSLVDDFVFSPGEPSNPGTIAAGPAGELYASGAVKMGTFQGHLRKSVDGGATWNSLAAVDPLDMKPIGGSGIVVDPAGVVYLIGGGSTGTGIPVGARVVRKSDDGGLSFTTIDAVPYDNSPCNTGSIARAPNGTLYTAGSCDATGWIIRRGDNAGASWSTVSTFELVAGHTARSGGTFVDAMGRVFVAVHAHDMLDVNHWIVRSGGTNDMWTTVDDFRFAMGAHASAASLGGRTRLYAVGAAVATPGPDFTGSHWVVRTADPVTGVWSTTDDYSTSSTSTGDARAIYEDPTGALLVVGLIDDGSGTNAAVARRSDDHGASWQVVDTYNYVAGKSSWPVAMTSDPAGNVYVLLRGLDATDNAHWLVRKLACN